MIPNKIQFTVIIPVYKIKEQYLRACINSLENQTDRRFNAIFIDDGSPDNCGEICDEYAKKNPNFHVIHQTNQGVSVARNTGILNAKTEWLAFIDPDDWVEATWAETINKAILEHGSDVDIFWFDYYQNYASKQFEKILYEKEGPFPQNITKNLKLAQFNQYIVNGKQITYETKVLWVKVYRASLFKERKIFFDPEARRGQDTILNAEMLQTTDRFFYLHKTLYHYRYIHESITNRYNPKVPYYNEVSFSHFQRIIKNYSLGEEYQKAFYAWVATRLYSCMKLYYFNADNPKNFDETCKEIDRKLESEPYRTSLQKVDASVLPFTYKLFVFFLKRRDYYLLRSLVNIRIWLQKIKGAQLG